MTDQLNVDVAKSYLIGYNAGLRAGLEKLDQAWIEINHQVSRSNGTEYGYGYERASEAALYIVEELGGMDPLKRSKE